MAHFLKKKARLMGLTKNRASNGFGSLKSVSSVTSKKLPNVCKSCPKMILLEK